MSDDASPLPKSTFVTFRNAFFSGVLLLAPLAVTVWAFSKIVDVVGGTFRPLYQDYLPQSLQRIPFFWDLAATGAVILFVMAAGMFRSLPDLRIDWDEHQKRSGPLLSAGIILSLSNPYWTIWWATIGLGYLLSCRTLGIAGVSAFFLGHIAGDFTWYSAVSALVSKGRHFLSDRVYRGLIGVCASFLICFACYFIYAGVSRLAG